MSAYPAPQPGYGPPPPGYGPPHRKGNANGVLAAVVAGAVIVVGVVSTVLLVTGDGNKDVRASLGSGSNQPTGSDRPTGSGRPTGRGSSGRSLPSARTNGPSVPDRSAAGGTVDLTEATSTGNDYFEDLDDTLYYSAQSKWCVGSAFPLSQADVMAVTSSYALSAARASGSQASMQGHISLSDGRSGSITVSLRPEDSQGFTWCITSQSSLS